MAKLAQDNIFLPDERRDGNSPINGNLKTTLAIAKTPVKEVHLFLRQTDGDMLAQKGFQPTLVRRKRLSVVENDLQHVGGISRWRRP